MGEWIKYTVGDKEARAYLALPDQGSGPGVLLCHAWWGLNGFFQGLADRFAHEGFVVLAPDLYDGRTAPTIEEAEALTYTLDYKVAINYETAAADCLLAHPATQGEQLGAVGFSLGAAYVTWLATLRRQVSAVVVFYGGVEQEADYAVRTKAAFLGHFAEADPYEASEEIGRLEEKLRAARRDVAFHVYPRTGHWFFENDRPDAYDAEAAELAWQRTVDFLHRKLGQPQAG
ncbi:MAG: dienelactone hydrolase family protein [Chloroflexota bacterium]|nr:dienelactone hydrolase family protein [Chloroflexota bacterium]